MTDTDRPLYRITVTKKNYEVMDEAYNFNPAAGLSMVQQRYGDDYLYIVEPYEEPELD